MTAANIQPAQAALLTKTYTGQLFTRGQMHMCKALQNGERLDGFPNVDATATASESLPSDIYKKVPHMSVCITTGKQKNFVGTVLSLHKVKPILMMHQMN